MVDYVPEPILTPKAITQMKEAIGRERMTYPGIVTAPLFDGWTIQTLDDHKEQTFDHARRGNAKSILLALWPPIENLIDDEGTKYERKIQTMTYAFERKKEFMRTQNSMFNVYEEAMPVKLTGKKRVAPKGPHEDAEHNAKRQNTETEDDDVRKVGDNELKPLCYACCLGGHFALSATKEKVWPAAVGSQCAEIQHICRGQRHNAIKG